MSAGTRARKLGAAAPPEVGPARTRLALWVERETVGVVPPELWSGELAPTLVTAVLVPEVHRPEVKVMPAWVPVLATSSPLAERMKRSGGPGCPPPQSNWKKFRWALTVRLVKWVRPVPGVAMARISMVSLLVPPPEGRQRTCEVAPGVE